MDALVTQNDDVAWELPSSLARESQSTRYLTTWSRGRARMTSWHSSRPCRARRRSPSWNGRSSWSRPRPSAVEVILDEMLPVGLRDLLDESRDAVAGAVIHVTPQG